MSEPVYISSNIKASQFNNIRIIIHNINYITQFIDHSKIKNVTQVIIRHLGREARAIRDLFITRLSIKDANKDGYCVVCNSLISDILLLTM